MLVLIVADNEFNAYCLTRLIESTCDKVRVMTVNGSYAALRKIAEKNPDLVVLDGDLGVGEGLYCNAPALADLLWRKFPKTPVIAWTDCERTRLAFADVFKRHNKQFDEQSIWPKTVYAQRLRKTLQPKHTFMEFADYGLTALHHSGRAQLN